MAPRKKANKNAPQPAPPQEPPKAIEPEQLDVVEDGDDLDGYPEGQRNEFHTTQAIYPDGFVRIRGRKDAWKTQENLAFQVQLTCLENPEIFVNLDVEFPQNYPKVQPKILILNTEPTDPKFKTQIDQTIKTVCRSNQGSGCVYEVTAAIDEYLNRTAVSKASKQTRFSLKEEQANRETAAQLEATQKEELARKEQAEQKAKEELLLVSKLDSERKRRQGTSSSKADDEMGDTYRETPPFKFDQPMTFRDASTNDVVSFTAVQGGAVILRRPDKEIYIVHPCVDTMQYQAPQFLLKHIYLSKNLASESTLRNTMREVEELLEKSKQHHHPNVIDLYGYQILDPQHNDGTWKLSILTEYANKGDLADQLGLHKALEPERVRRWAQELLSALQFFNQHKFIHPAIHAGNLLLCHPREDIWNLKLSDGYGTKLRDLVDQAQGKVKNASNENLYWTPCELRNDLSQRNSATCIWDLGKVVLQMAVGKDVFSKYMSPFQCMKLENFSQHFEALLNDLFVEKPDKRKTAHDLLPSQFFFDKDPQIFNKLIFGARSMPQIESSTSSSSRWHSDWHEVERLGKGGQGTVFKARKISDQALYAVKVLKAENAQALARIRKEVLMLSNLKHHTIVRYYDTWVEQRAPSDSQTTTTEDTGTTSIFSPPVEPSSYRQLRPSTAALLEWPSDVRSPAVPNTGHDFMESRLRQPSERVASEVDDDDDSDGGSGGGLFAYQKPAAANDDDSESYNNAFGNPASNNDDLNDGLNDDLNNDFDRVSDLEGKPTESALQHAHNVDKALSKRTYPDQEAILYIQMELCDKRTLNTLIWNERLPSNTDLMWRIFRFVLDGLRYIHGKSITHRDLKPDNIFLDQDNIPRIGDFGLATPTHTTLKNAQVGTSFYIAPEMLRGDDSVDSGSKVDMYALGIILFEMNYQMQTFGERLQTLTALSKPNHTLPSQFENENYKVQSAVILELTDHNPANRPMAGDLIKRTDIPDPMDDAKLRRQVDKMLETDPEPIYKRMFSRSNDEISDHAWEYQGGDLVPESFLYSYVTEKIQSVFHRHGAVSTSRQGLFPKVDHYDNAVTVMGETGLLLQLPYDLTLPFARSIAQKNPQYAKCYCFGTIYRQFGTAGDEPRRIPEVDFDFVSYSDHDLPLKEAETIYVLDEILREIPALQARNFIIVLNHIDLLDLILRHCDVLPGDMAKVKKELSRLYTKRVEWDPDITSALRSASNNIRPTVVSAISQFVKIGGTPDAVRKQLQKILNQPDRTQAMNTISRLEQIITHLHTFGISSEVLIAPLSNTSEQLYRSGTVFQCLSKKPRAMLAAGGRYDSLIKQYHHNEPFAPLHAVGFRLNITDIVNYIQTDLAGPSVKQRSSAKGRSSSVPPRCEVVVTSFDASAISTSCLECVKTLWADGISAEVSEAVASMEELEALYADEKGWWLVIVKGGGEMKPDRALKVRSPLREESEVEFARLPEWLKVEMKRKRK